MYKPVDWNADKIYFQRLLVGTNNAYATDVQTFALFTFDVGRGLTKDTDLCQILPRDEGACHFFSLNHTALC